MADQAAGVAGEIAKDVWRMAIAQIGKELGYLIHYNRNIDGLKKQKETLKARSKDIERNVEQAKRNGDIIAHEVELWLTQVNKLVEEVARFIEVEVAENKGCLHGWCPNIKKCRSLSKEAKEKTIEAAELQIKQFEKIAYPPPPPAVGDRYIGDYKVFDSRTPRLNEMMELLRDDASHMICLCGMGGAGKTTMVHEIAIRAKDEKLFDEIVEAVASQNHDKMKTQQEIARYLGLELKETTLEARADKLWKRLLQSKKGNLVIIDDVWGSFDLKEIGIPCGGEHKNCKVVLTSRSVDVCRLIGCHKFVRLDVLTPKESWSLFKENAGDSCYKQSLYQTASEIVGKCDGLPIALKTLGAALNGKTDDEWVETLEKMKKSTVPENIGDMDDKVYLSLKASYNLLKNKEAKSLFLLCCLYPEDWIIYEDDLVYYTLGLDCFDGIDDYLSRARRRVRVLTEELKRCNLLLDGGSRKLGVKVHDVLRVVGNTIASSEEAKADFPLSPAMVVHGEKWKNRAAVESCKALSVVSNKIVDFGSSRMDFPVLEVLQLSCRNLASEAVRTMFEGMGEIKVVIMWGMWIPSFSLSPLLLKKMRVLVLHSKTSGGLITIKDLDNLVILRLSGDYEGFDLGNLINLRLLDISGCHRRLNLSTAGFISQLKQLEELRAEPAVPSYGGGGLGSLAELESLTCLSYLGIKVKDIKDLSTTLFLGRLERYVIYVGYMGSVSDGFKNSFSERKIFLNIRDKGCTDLGGGVDRLLEESVEILYLEGDGVEVALKKIGSGSGGHRCLKVLVVRWCRSEMVEDIIADCNGFEVVFPRLEILHVQNVWHFKKIVGHNNSGQGLIPTGSFAKLREIQLHGLPALSHHQLTFLFAENLGLLETLSIEWCGQIVEIISTAVSGNRRLVFQKLNRLVLKGLKSLECFCHGIELVDLPQLQTLELGDLPELVSFCPEDQTSVATQSNDNIDASLQPLFNSKVRIN